MPVIYHSTPVGSLKILFAPQLAMKRRLHKFSCYLFSSAPTVVLTTLFCLAISETRIDYHHHARYNIIEDACLKIYC